MDQWLCFAYRAHCGDYGARGPGFAGTFEFALKGGFALLVLSNESRENITVYILLLHAAQLLVQVGFGALYLLLGAVKLSDLRQAE